MADPRPSDKRGGGHKNIFFLPFGPQFGLKIRGGPRIQLNHIHNIYMTFLQANLFVYDLCRLPLSAVTCSLQPKMPTTISTTAAALCYSGERGGISLVVGQISMDCIMVDPIAVKKATEQNGKRLKDTFTL